MVQHQYEKDPFKGTFGSLENLVDRISEVIKCPITIEDANHRLLAYSTHSDATDSARIATIIGRRVPEKVINSLWRDGIIQKLVQSDDPLRISTINEIGLGNRVAISIRKNNEVLGYIWALEIGNPLTDGDLILLKNAAQAAKNQLLQLQIRKKKKEEGYQEFFWQLLTGHVKTHEEIKEKIEQLDITPPPKFSVLVFKFQEEITTKTEQQITYMITTTQQVKITFHVADRRELILLASPHSFQSSEKSMSGFIEAFISQMKKRFGIEHIIGSSGTIYENYEKIEKSYQEALTVTSLKGQFPDEMSELYSYQQIGIYRYLDIILEKKRMDNYENPTLLKLIDYDNIHKSHMLETLEVFLNKDSNVNDAAQALHVHTNTLNYRLKRISEIGEIDLKNPNQKMTLFLDIKLRKLDKNGHL